MPKNKKGGGGRGGGRGEIYHNYKWFEITLHGMKSYHKHLVTITGCISHLVGMKSHHIYGNHTIWLEIRP